MSDVGLSIVEQGMRVAQERAVVLAADAANARTPGFAPRDIAAVPVEGAGGARFAAMLQDAGPGGAGGVEGVMSATAQNSLRFRALADQERAMLREFRTVAEEARR